MTLYTLILFIHLTGALTLFLAFGIEWAAISFLGRATTPVEAQTWLRLGRLAPLINGPALLLAILSGGYLASLISAFKQGWIPASFVGIVVVAVLGGAINAPKMRAIRLAIPVGGEKLAAALGNKLLPVSVRLRTFAALSIVFMMATKLPFARCMFALLGGLILGLLFCIPVFARKAL
ncbi:MAG TPA: hypothetical protein VN025_00805 [Candidatus Dormibacteraeota bacterium]|jgi:hypothetical protein|nr:hypothetical protein [Candidatus Dormibacteraeota bacterium]